MTTVWILLGVLAIFLLAFLLFRTAAISRDGNSIPEADLVDIDAGQAAARLANLITFKTLSTFSAGPSGQAAYPTVQALSGLQKALQEQYPLVHRKLRVETLGGYSLLYTWTGSDAALKPILMLAHQDVVPVEEGTQAGWDEDPFSGRISGGYIWGRGALDYKNGMAGALEAVEHLLKQGYQPQRGVCLAFGHDEELGGFRGARPVVQALQKRGAAFESILDEGGLVLDGLLPGTRRPVALVGITEKGYLSLELCVETTGGHSSMAGSASSISILCRALSRIEQQPFRAHTVYVRRLLRSMAADLPFGTRFLVANSWLFGGLLDRRIRHTERLHPVIRTASAATMLAAGVKENVLPRQARAVVNFRLFPGEHTGEVISRVEEIIGDSRVEVRPVQLPGILQEPGSPSGKIRKQTREVATPAEAPLRMAVLPGEVVKAGGWESPPPSNPESTSFRLLETTIRQVFPDAGVAPFLTPTATDARHYTPLSENILRFTPIRLAVEDLDRLHGNNERISVENYTRQVQFYIQWICNNDDPTRVG